MHPFPTTGKFVDCKVGMKHVKNALVSEPHGRGVVITY
jgi:hypothetical protein